MSKLEDSFHSKFNNRNFDKFRKASKRILVKNSQIKTKETFTCRVIASFGKSFIVEPIELSITSLNELIICQTKGTLITESDSNYLIAVGDIVEVQKNKKETQEYKTGKIISVQKRTSTLSRTAIGSPNEHVFASNVDKLLIIMAATEPAYNKKLIDRFIIAAEQGSVEPIICINKIDLFDSELMNEDLEIYIKLGIRLFFISCARNSGISELKKLLENSSTVLSGPSGVGKSTLINKLLGEEIQPVNIISERTLKGKHTTSSVKLFHLDNGGIVIDTPGIREFALWNVFREELPFYFHDFDDYYRDCKYLPCTHIHEPDCKVKKAVEDGLIDQDRYESYLNIFDTIED